MPQLISFIVVNLALYSLTTGALDHENEFITLGECDSVTWYPNPDACAENYYWPINQPKSVDDNASDR